MAAKSKKKSSMFPTVGGLNQLEPNEVTNWGAGRSFQCVYFHPDVHPAARVLKNISTPSSNAATGRDFIP